MVLETKREVEMETILTKKEDGLMAENAFYEIKYGPYQRNNLGNSNRNLPDFIDQNILLMYMNGVITNSNNDAVHTRSLTMITLVYSDNDHVEFRNKLQEDPYVIGYFGDEPHMGPHLAFMVSTPSPVNSTGILLIESYYKALLKGSEVSRSGLTGFTDPDPKAVLKEDYESFPLPDEYVLFPDNDPSELES